MPLLKLMWSYVLGCIMGLVLSGNRVLEHGIDEI